MSSKKCSICNTELPNNIFILHERCCKFNMRKCSICDTTIQIDEYDEHKKEFHSKIPCELCGKILERSMIEQHKSKCSKKKIQCQFCNLELLKDQVIPHENMCGSKTEECPLCNERVPIREFDLHLEFLCKKIKVKEQEDIKEKGKSVNEILSMTVLNCKKKYNDNKEEMIEERNLKKDERERKKKKDKESEEMYNRNDLKRKNNEIKENNIKVKENEKKEERKGSKGRKGKGKGKKNYY